MMQPPYPNQRLAVSPPASKNRLAPQNLQHTQQQKPWRRAAVGDVLLAWSECSSERD